MKNIKHILAVISLLLFSACSEDTIDALGSGTIAGTVVTEGTNEPIQNVRISTNPASSTVFTDENGIFILEDIAEGDYSVEARKEGLLTQFEGATVRPNTEVSVIFELEPESANNRQPEVPRLLSPADNATDVAIPVEFVWSSGDRDGDELVYELELRNGANDQVRTFSNITDTTYTVTDLNQGYKYFWQVKVSDSVNDPVLSPVFAFQTAQVSGGRYLYVKQINGNNVIFSSNGEGSEIQLTASDVNSFRPRRNNSSNKIAFLRTVGGRTQLFTMNSDGSNQFQVTSNISVNGYDMEKVGFSWANDGVSLVFPNFGDLYQVSATGGGIQRIYRTPNGKFITDVDVSEDDSTIALLTNDPNGYNGSIFTISPEGQLKQSVISGVDGALGSIDIAVDNSALLFTRDISEYENENNRQLDSRMFIYNFSSGEIKDISYNKPEGTNDLDPRFSPNEAEVIFVNTSNDGLSPLDIYTQSIGDDSNENENRNLLFQNAKMPDWE
ncbi:carboxypeptidase regulatory-like domain-containing protein [Salegentibacter sp. F188]|uniref:Carboxypeptidase regulatory-like domain-containing protein n=1 Tax=Autumnicola patrickiae TaxID=3075591 RepID=A0ABU3E0Q1_9FLAO|nr:carboxypeptidase regulatory-like domain-containing protein [Salegentibacter sp. F188]MDT0689559.1 carboxypeptidase regulatory-like domain-containing protein [Salegentibacter sp. F188]